MARQPDSLGFRFALVLALTVVVVTLMTWVGPESLSKWAAKKKKEFVPLAPSVIRVLSNKYLNELAKDLKQYGSGVSMFVGLLRVQDQGWADKQYDQLYGDPGIHAAILRIRGPQNCPNADSQQSAENRRSTQKWQRRR